MTGASARPDCVLRRCVARTRDRQAKAEREVAGRERATGLRFIRCEGGDVAGPALLQKRDEFVVDGRVAHSMGKDIDSCACGDLGSVQRDRMGEDFDSGFVCIFDDRRESFYIHVGQIVACAVAPAVGEGLDDIRLVGEDLLHRGMRLCRSAYQLGEVIPPSELCAVSFRSTEADGEVHLWADQNAATLQASGEEPASLRKRCNR